jgi:hypothetical protein
MELSVYDVAGRKVARILDKPGEPGYYRVPWNGRDARGLSVASGLYFYRLTVCNDKGAIRFNKTRKMLMIK